MKIAINIDYGGFSLSEIAEIMLLRKKGYKELFFYANDFNDRYDTIGYKKITEKEFANNSKISMKVISKKDFGDYIEMPNTRVKDVDKTQRIFDEFHENIIYFRDFTEDRTNKDLIDVIETVGVECASGRFAKLKIIDIPNDVEYEIDSYDGLESVHEKHRVWG